MYFFPAKLTSLHHLEVAWPFPPSNSARNPKGRGEEVTSLDGPAGPLTKDIFGSQGFRSIEDPERGRLEDFLYDQDEAVELGFGTAWTAWLESVAGDL